MLSSFDLCFLLVTLIMEALAIDPRILQDPTDPPPTRPAYVALFPKFLFPLWQIFQTASIYMTVAICLNRYLIVYYTKKSN